MSIKDRAVPGNCDIEKKEGRDPIEMLIRPRDRNIGVLPVRRVLPTRQRRSVGPWVFFDHMGPVDFEAGNGIDVPSHPHINLATVTYLFEGELLHRDSLGSSQTIRPGDINLMVAGKGIVHSERERPQFRETRHRQHGLQLWLALPEEIEETEPAFYHYADFDIPEVDVDGVAVRVMMGSAYGAVSPVITFAQTLYLECALEAGQRIALPPAPERAVYVVSGELRIAGTAIPEYTMAVLSDATDIVLEAGEETRVAIIGGKSPGRRYIDWNFVSSRRQRIDRARADWKAGAFPRVPGDEDEFIPLPE